MIRIKKGAPCLAGAALVCLAGVVPAASAEDPASEVGRSMHLVDAPPRVDLPEGGVIIPMPDYGNRPVVELTINGHGPHRFILDTGAGGSVVDAGLAEELELPEVGRELTGSPVGEEPLEVSRVAMGTVALDAIVIHDLKAAAMDLSSYFRDPDGPQGVLSATVFSGMLLSIDYPGRTIAIRPGELGPADGARIFQYEESDRLPTVTLSVAGTKVRVHLDTGSPGQISLPGRYMRTLPLKSEPVLRGKARLVDAEIELYAAPLDGTVSLGEYTFEGPEIVFADRFPAGNLGHGVLREFAVTMDFRNRRVKLDRAAGPAVVMSSPRALAPGPARMMRKAPGGSQRKRYGIAFEAMGTTPLEVRGVDPGSPAAKAGLKAGDRIVMMNGRPVADLDSDQRASLFRASPLTLVVERDGEEVRIEMSL
jgi:hypothetical protein